MLNLNAPPLLDDLIRLGFEPYHGRQVGMNGISGAILCCNNSINRAAK